MKLELQGIISRMGEEKSGSTDKGDWSLRGFTLMIKEKKTTKHLPFTAWNDAVPFLNKCNVNDEVKVTFSIDHKKNKQEVWETKLNAFSVERIKESALKEQAKEVITKLDLTDVSDDDLPF